MKEKVHLELSDIVKVFQRVKRPAGTLKPFSRSGPISSRLSTMRLMKTSSSSLPLV
jgi:hypothetical protein